jgi:hypothetical protein
VTSDSMMLGAVSVQYDDYLGTAAADDADAMLGSRSLYQMVGLDREQWLIVSVELARSKVSERVSVYAIDRYQYPIRGLAELQERPDFAYGVPVVAFDLPSSVSVDRFVAEAFQRLSVRLVSQALGGQNLAVSDRRPVDEQLQSDQLEDSSPDL